MPTQLNITILQNSGGSSGGTTTSSVVVVPIPSGLQALDSGNSGGSGQVQQLNQVTGLWSVGQTGFSSIDILIRSIFKAGCFFVASSGTWYSVDQIQGITFQ